VTVSSLINNSSFKKMQNYELHWLCCIFDASIPLVKYIQQQVTELEYSFQTEQQTENSVLIIIMIMMMIIIIIIIIL
jgi:hypothetical protein